MFDENKAETRIPVDSAEDICRQADLLRAPVARYLAPTASATPEPAVAQIGAGVSW
ncbi:hypothetical protein [Amycolatopsis sp. FDAARGOS 1241]|uniref:hypothetical protein n=1 Tax=Amycolatopsis sp. FDAARGOS 1241 TaxID=2778070 RepID=UPI00195144D8|nr:hypothetical protein [Amycolatopsis sp. FDAARGOS 1241]QRP48374.1 hypothetical protein I6J71_11245 [Amycolatopsis sp. FDAARGOS 1241]